MDPLPRLMGNDPSAGGSDGGHPYYEDPSEYL